MGEPDSSQLLPNEKTDPPDPEAVPPAVTTSQAFGGDPLRESQSEKDPQERAEEQNQA